MFKQWLTLADRAIEAGPAGLDNSLYRALAARFHAGPILPGIDLKAMLKIAQFAVNMRVIPEARTAGRNGIPQHILDRKNQPFQLLARNFLRLPLWIDPGTEQGFGDIDITKPGHQFLVKQRSFHIGLSPLQPFLQMVQMKFIAERFRSDAREQRVRPKLILFRECHQTESSGIVENNPGAFVGYKNNMIMLAERAPVLSTAQHHPARHTEMNNQDRPAFRLNQQVFCAATHPDDSLAFQPGGKVRRQGPAQIGPSCRNLDKPSSLKHGDKTLTHRFDFGKFRHKSPICAGAAQTAGLWSHRIKRDHRMTGKTPQAAKTAARTEETHFGFQTVAAGDKSGLVRSVFDSVANRYDLMNDVMSGGLHRLWKTSLIDQLRPFPEMAHLDVAGGTGDIAFRTLAALKGKKADITVCDINREMLQVGKKRAAKKGCADKIDWLCADAESLPLPSRSVDAYTIAFGIRNVTHIDRVLSEAFRVLKPGGRFLCLEFSHLAIPGFDRLYEAYSFRLIPALGQWITKDRESYQYLVESIRRFPDQAHFTAMIREAGFERVTCRNLSGGIVALHAGWRI